VKTEEDQNYPKEVFESESPFLLQNTEAVLASSDLIDASLNQCHKNAT
jgi:hypothetical protein